MGDSELNIYGGTAQHVVINISGVEGLQRNGEGNRGRIELCKVLSILLPAGLFHSLVAGNGEWDLAGRACEELPLLTSRAHEVGGNSALGGLAMGARWVCWQQETQKSGQPGSDGKPHSATAAGLQITERRGALGEQGRCAGERCVKSELPSEDRWTSHRKREARKMGMPQKTCHLVRGAAAFRCCFFCKVGILLLILSHGFVRPGHVVLITCILRLWLC